MTGRIAKRIASGIGLAREGTAHHRESKEAEQQNLAVPQDGPPRSRSQSPASSLDSEEDYDNELWVLDDVEQQEAPSTNPFLHVDNEEDLIKAFGPSASTSIQRIWDTR